MEEALVAYLLADAGLSALVGTRINWLQRPQGATLPAITLQVVSAPRDYTLTGRDRFVGYLVQMDVWGATYTATKAVSRALELALDGLTSAPFQTAIIENERDGYEADSPTGSATGIYRTSLDVRCWASQPV